MKPIRPTVTIPGDREDKIMGQTGWIVGFRTHGVKPHQVVWCFGFLPDTPQAKAYGVSVDKPVWVLTDKKGNIEGTFSGLQKDLPWIFKYVLDDYKNEEKK